MYVLSPGGFISKPFHSFENRDILTGPLAIRAWFDSLLTNGKPGEREREHCGELSEEMSDFFRRFELKEFRLKREREGGGLASDDNVYKSSISSSFLLFHKWLFLNISSGIDFSRCLSPSSSSFSLFTTTAWHPKRSLSTNEARWSWSHRSSWTVDWSRPWWPHKRPSFALCWSCWSTLAQKVQWPKGSVRCWCHSGYRPVGCFRSRLISRRWAKVLCLDWHMVWNTFVPFCFWPNRLWRVWNVKRLNCLWMKKYKICGSMPEKNRIKLIFPPPFFFFHHVTRCLLQTLDFLSLSYLTVSNDSNLYKDAIDPCWKWTFGHDSDRVS